MGFFVGTDPENSLTLLRRLPDLKARFGLPLLVSVSRKSFLRKITGQDDPARPAVWPPAWRPNFCRSLKARIICAPTTPAPLKAALKLQSALNAGDFNEQRR